MTPSEVTAALVALGSSPDEIAASLRRASCSGTPGDPFRCPLAHYLRQVGVERPVVWSGEAGVRYGPDPVTGYVRQRADVPADCRRFARWFDDGDYPDLVRIE